MKFIPTGKLDGQRGFGGGIGEPTRQVTSIGLRNMEVGTRRK